MNIPDYLEVRNLQGIIYLDKVKLVNRRKLVHDLITIIMSNRNSIICYKGFIISDIYVCHLKNGNRESFIKELNNVVHIASRTKYEMPKVSALISPSVRFKPLLFLCDMYNNSYSDYRKLYCKTNIEYLNSFNYFCKELDKFYKTEEEFDMWYLHDLSLPRGLKELIRTHVSFLDDDSSKIVSMTGF